MSQAMLDEAQITTLRLLGHAYWRLGYLEKAERLLKALLSFLPQDGLCLRQLAAIALQSGRPEEALSRLALLPKEEPAASDPTVALTRAQALWRLGRSEEARAAFGDYLKGQTAEAGAA
jgi:predicted Zn-dependent protease